MENPKNNNQKIIIQAEYTNAIINLLEKHQIFYSTIGEIVEDNSLLDSEKLEAIIKYGTESKKVIYDGPEVKIIESYNKLE